MRHWEELNEGDNISYIILTMDEVDDVIDNNIKIKKALITEISNNGKNMIIFTDDEGILDEIGVYYDEYFTKGSDTIETEDSLVVVSASEEGVIYEIRKLFEDISLSI